jgi:sugar phosphate permease
MRDVEGSESGLASGLLNTSRLMGAAIGLAVLSTIAASQTRGDVGTAAARALTDGFDLAFVVAAVFCVAAGLIALIALRSPAQAERAPALDDERFELEELEEREAIAA